jgi:hypothetical protein
MFARASLSPLLALIHDDLEMKPASVAPADDVQVTPYSDLLKVKFPQSRQKKRAHLVVCP